MLEEERSLETRIEARRRQDERRLLGTPEAKSSDPGERSLDALLADYQDLEGRLREASPRYSALARPHPLSVHEIREQVLDGDTLLLEYALGEERSFVWAVTKGTLTSHALPGRSVVEAAARRLYQAWSANDPAGDRRARALSRMVLGPVADQLGARRLAIVAEGMLQYLPFGALPAPNSVGASVPLVATQEVITLPSATTLAVLRREVSGRSAPGERVAVLADPVFDRRDPRVLAGGRSGGSARNDVVDDALTRSMKETGALKLERLPASRREARAIAGLAGARKSFVALDFEASRANSIPFVGRHHADEIAPADDLYARDVFDRRFVHLNHPGAVRIGTLTSGTHHAAVKHVGEPYVLHVHVSTAQQHRPAPPPLRRDSAPGRRPAPAGP